MSMMMLFDISFFSPSRFTAEPIRWGFHFGICRDVYISNEDGIISRLLSAIITIIFKHTAFQIPAWPFRHTDTLMPTMASC